MYLAHFGLDAHPFKITPATDFFFSGANRGEILDALIYAITEGEGIVKVTGEVGSGKTMLCRMLLERLPAHVEAVYLANPSLSREEMLQAIADGLSLDLESQRVNVILRTLQNRLEQKIAQGRRIVIIVDEAHAMPPATMEELRLLYNMQAGNRKLLHIVLFGQPELNDKLVRPNMRQLRDRIVHHFRIQPLSQSVVDAYLLFRMRAAGYRGPALISGAAAALIGKASQGLLRRVNILADKALLAAYVEDTHHVDVRHVRAAIRDSELVPIGGSWLSGRVLRLAGGIVLVAAVLSGMARLPGNRHAREPAGTQAAAPTPAPGHGRDPDKAAAVAGEAPVAQGEPDGRDRGASATTEPRSGTLLQQRLAAADAVLREHAKGSASIQLFYTDVAQPARIEGFLRRANSMDKLAEIYVLPVHANGRHGYRVLYGVYRSSEAAREGMQRLPQRYKEGFEPVAYALDSARAF